MLRIGTSGWQYRHWRDRYYPRGLAQGDWLDFYVRSFDTVELNVTFYRQPRPSVFEGWARRVPDGFVFAVKASRYLTHVRRLLRPRESVELLMEGAERLGDRLGPVLIQLPPDMRVEPDRLADALDAFPPGVRVALEPRHASWFHDEVRAILTARDAALCWADRRGPLIPAWRTADWGYVRFHGGRASPRPCYGDAALATWAGRIAETWPADADVFAYFNNDPGACALRDASVFGRLAERRGLRPTRTVEVAAVRVG
jgi:uncharacterized protein YecE (DUF72 family)